MRKSDDGSVEEFAGLLALLASDPPPDVVLRALVSGVLAPMRVERASLHVLSADGGSLRMVGAHGYPDGSTERFVSVDARIDLPVTRVLAGSIPSQFTVEELREQFALLAADDTSPDIADLGDDASTWTFLPILLHARPGAVLAMLGQDGGGFSTMGA